MYPLVETCHCASLHRLNQPKPNLLTPLNLNPNPLNPKP